MNPDGIQFAKDLYQGTAAYYDRYRLPYPAAMLDQLVAASHARGTGRLLDLACGTGQLAFPLSGHFAEVWAVDQEPDMIETVRAKAAADGIKTLQSIVSSAETLDAPTDSFELAVIGNAFHRLDRALVARRTFRWLAPGGHLALCWSSSPWIGVEDWQRALAATLDRWRRRLGADQRIPTSAEQARKDLPDTEVLAEAGFEIVGRHTFTAEHTWTLEELAGHIRSTSFLPPAVLGGEGGAFDTDLAASLLAHGADGTFAETVHSAYDLARKPPIR